MGGDVACQHVPSYQVLAWDYVRDGERVCKGARFHIEIAVAQGGSDEADKTSQPSAEHPCRWRLSAVAPRLTAAPAQSGCIRVLLGRSERKGIWDRADR